MRYRDSGVDIDKANEATRSIAASVRKTWGEAVLSEVGHFGGLFRMPEEYKEPVLVSSMDGVGTKVLVAKMAGRFDTVGQDLVNHCVNDILVQGARPLFFLDYLAAGKLRPDMVTGLVAGLAKACQENECALVGGETAEMPGVYTGSDFDLAGCIVGVVERKGIIDGSSIEPGDVLFALPSNGLHTNGYSLVRRVVFESMEMSLDDDVGEFGHTLGDELLKVHRSYLSDVDRLRQLVTVKGMAHITGGGIVENLPRIFPKSRAASIQKGSWPIPSIFLFLQKNGDIPEAEMYRVFNMGVGMIIVVSAGDANALAQMTDEGEMFRIGEVVAGDGSVDID